ncbi:Cell death specification protein 2 [Frankliniella fusca]|uniref:Cell death specification protein 2 n=1 Tax=Frankliniella fusca TaxID=407009 RepID=A0AAE1H7T2_9NEOP|nr:Cell death specification protein 2 [Frankliniella fusca]
MGSNRVVPASASMPTTLQTHTPSGLSSPMSPQIPALDMSSSIKTEPQTHLDAAMSAHCHSENWVESYQDLSSWCSATSASSPATCPSPAIDESLVCDFDFRGEIDFDLRKSEEIASIPLEEDCSLNLWGAESQSPGDTTSRTLSVSAVTSTEKPNPVLLKDCWWPEIEKEKVVKKLQPSRLQTLTTLPDSSVKNHLHSESQLPVTVKEEVTDIKENMNPVVAPQNFLSDPIKMAELQMRIERITSVTHPGVNSKAKANDLMKILQQQIAALNKKKYSSPAAISDLHNYSKIHLAQGVPSTSTAGIQFQPPKAVMTSVAEVAQNDSIFHSDPFENLFATPVNQTQIVASYGHTAVPPSTSSHHSYSSNATPTPTFVSNSGGSNSVKPMVQSSAVQENDLFFEAHHEIMKIASKPQEGLSQPSIQFVQPSTQYSAPQPQAFSASTFTTAPTGFSSMKKESGLSIKMPPPRVNMPDLDLNFDALLFGSPGVIAGGNKTPAISTPEVLKSLVETPDPETFDLLSYLCDDKLNTPPVNLDNNPFHFPQPSTSHSIPVSSLSTTSTSSQEPKPNVMVVRPLVSSWVKEEKEVEPMERNDIESAVVVEVKPHLLPRALSDVEEEKGDENFSVNSHPAGSIKEEQTSPRPSRTARKRKYSEDEFVLSPSTSDEMQRSTRRRRSSSKYDSDEEFTLPVRKSRKKSVTTIVEEDEEESTETKSKRPRTTVKRGERTVSSSSETDRYRELRDRNNEASRKSRLTRKAREQELGKQAETLTKENMVLKVKVEEMESLVKKLRDALLQSMMKKS